MGWIFKSKDEKRVSLEKDLAKAEEELQSAENEVKFTKKQITGYAESGGISESQFLQKSSVGQNMRKNLMEAEEKVTKYAKIIAALQDKIRKSE